MATFNQNVKVLSKFSYDDMPCTGLNTKGLYCTIQLRSKMERIFQMGDTIGAVSYLQILAPELTDKMLSEFLEWTVTCLLICISSPSTR